MVLNFLLFISSYVGTNIYKKLRNTNRIDYELPKVKLTITAEE